MFQCEWRIRPAWLGYLRERPEALRDELRVRAALRAACERLERVLRRAADLAWLDSARREAPDRPSPLSTSRLARDRLADGRLLREERWLLLSFWADAVPSGGGGSFTPAFRAFDSPIAIACLGFLTPCFPSLTW